jgi:prephenate dehydratase
MPQYSIPIGEALHEPDAHIASMEPSVVRYLGPPGSFSADMAHVLFFRDSPGYRNPIFKDSADFSKVVESLEHDPSAIGVLPVDNTLTSPVQAVTDALLDGNLYALAEAKMKIDIMLAGIEGADLEKVRTIISHTKPFGQAKKFLERKRNYQLIPVESTATAAQEVSDMNDPTVAALCGRTAVEAYGLTIIEESVQDRPDNQTRFLVVQSRDAGNQPQINDLQDNVRKNKKNDTVVKVAGIVSPTHSGEDSFYEVMATMIDRRVHPHWLGRRNTQTEDAGGDADYFVEFQGYAKTLLEVMREPKNYNKQMHFRLLGIYPVGSLYEG